MADVVIVMSWLEILQDPVYDKLKMVMYVLYEIYREFDTIF